MNQRTDEEVLIGQKILKVEQTDEITIKFSTENGEIILHFDPDCCSDAYIYDIRGNIDGQIVKSIQVTKGEEVHNASWVLSKIKQVFGVEYFQDYHTSWGFDITTLEGGRMEIRHLNTSNGYYDSFAEWNSNLNDRTNLGKFKVFGYDNIFNSLNDAVKFQFERGINPRMPRQVKQIVKNLDSLSEEEIDLFECGFIVKSELTEEKIQEISKYAKLQQEAILKEYNSKPKIIISGFVFLESPMSVDDAVGEALENAKYSWNI